MNPAFWDSSALVPLCVQQPSSPAADQLARKYATTVWWGTAVEVRSALERLLRAGALNAREYAFAEVRLEWLRTGWREVEPSAALRTQAERFLSAYPLRAADALQLAAAFTWAGGAPHPYSFLSGDAQLLQAARQVGFQIVPV